MGMDILELAREVGAAQPANLYGRTDYIVMTFHELERFAALVAAAKRKAILAALEKLRDESQTIVGASDDYKQGRAMGIQLCINELTRVRDD